MRICGIDPGKNGGMAWGDGTPGVVECAKIPDTTEGMVALLRIIAPDQVTLEQVGGFIGKAQTGASMFSFGRSYGELHGALTALNIPYTLLTPQAWQKALQLGNSKGMTKTSWKGKLKKRAEELYPATKITLATSDAVLIYHATAYQPHKHIFNAHENELGF